MSLLIGCDPELFVQNSKTHEFVSAHNLFPGTKYDPSPVGNVGAIQVDGTAFEFNIAPASSVTEFISHINSVLHLSRVHLEKQNSDLVLCTEPVALFDKYYFDKVIPEEAKLLGCEPDYNAWTGKVNPKPKTNKPMRTGSGHVHIGWSAGEDIEDTSHIYDCREMVKQLDVGLFIPSLLWDSSHERRQLYGAPGAFRPKHYGCEYRVLSNKWVGNRELMEFVFDATKHSSELLDKDVRLYEDKEFNHLVGALSVGDMVSHATIRDAVTRLEEDFDFPILELAA